MKDLQAILLPGEKLLWQGRPAHGVRFRSRDFIQSASGALVLLSSLAMSAVALSQGSTINLLWSAPFSLVGAYMCFGRYLSDAYIRSSTNYLLTDRRAVIEVDIFFATRQQVMLRSLAEISLEEYANGLGTIVFGQDITVPDGEGTKTTYAPCFEFVPEARRVYQLAEAQRVGQ